MKEKIRGYFGVGIENSSKQMNVGNLFRTAHAFGASFLFTINAQYSIKKVKSDTSIAPKNIPWYDYESYKNFKLPIGCSLIGVEFQEDSIELPNFRHPLNTAYILGPELGGLSPEILKICLDVVKIPTKFSLNVATAGAIILYDRFRTLGKFGKRPLSSLDSPIPPMEHVHGEPIKRKK
tara:strand:- start:292 stop:828 length:537 start_codon:yes stop_codon:yes gene_type:complete